MATELKRKKPAADRESEPDREPFELGWTDDESEPGSYLFCGRPGAGKTKLASTFPGVRLWINIDRGLRTVSDLHDPKVTIAGHKDLWMRMLRLAWAIADYDKPFNSLKGKLKTVILDDLSRLSRRMDMEVIDAPPDAEGRKEKGITDPLEAMRIQDYNTVGIRLTKIVNAFKDIPNVVFVATMGVNYESDQRTGYMVDQPDATGRKLGPQLTHYFDTVLFLSRDKDNFVAQVKPTKSFPYARIRFVGDVPPKLPTRIATPTYKIIREIELKQYNPDAYQTVEEID